MAPFISIITPTVERESLAQCCASIEEQNFSSWEHIIAVDKPEVNWDFMNQFSHPQRQIFCCGKAYRNSGNTPRHMAWERAQGEYVYHLDCDNFLFSHTTLQEIHDELRKANDPEWALFPIFRHGHLFFFDPPRPCYFDTGNAVVKWGIAQWPDINDYASDAVWLQSLLAHPYLSLPHVFPIMNMPSTSFGQGGGINGQ